jgi:hypothetical protein
MKRTPLKRKTRLRPFRPTLRRDEPTPAEKQAARILARERASGMCQIRESPQCTQDKVLPLNGPLLVRGHLHHVLSKRRFGWMESTETDQRHLFACPWCHGWLHNGGKPCPPKPVNPAC